MTENLLIINNDDFEILLEKKLKQWSKKVHSPNSLDMISRLNVIVYT